jgi:hypothetical protein
MSVPLVAHTLGELNCDSLSRSAAFIFTERWSVRILKMCIVATSYPPSRSSHRFKWFDSPRCDALMAGDHRLANPGARAARGSRYLQTRIASLSKLHALL